MELELTPAYIHQNLNVYPSTRTVVHNDEIPTDKRSCVRNGTPVHCQNRDIRFPTVWEVKDHPKTHGRFVKKNWVILVDTSKEARLAASIFEASLTTPLGPDARMKEYGRSFYALSKTIFNSTIRVNTSRSRNSRLWAFVAGPRRRGWVSNSR